MRYPSATRLIALCLLGAWLAGCAKPAHTPAPNSAAPISPPSQTQPPAPRDKPPRAVPTAASFLLYQGPAGFFDPETARPLQPGETAVVGTGTVELDVLLPGVPEAAARQAVRVNGATTVVEPQWLQDGRVRLRLAPGKAGDQVTVTAAAPGAAVVTVALRRAAPATVTVDQRYGDGWQPVTILTAHAQPGPTTVRLLFSKPVRRTEVEAALTEAQSTPVRGLMEWESDRTLIWHINELPPRLDFLLGGAHDQDGMALPGGIPSLRSGEPPVLVKLGPGGAAEEPLLTLPPDIRLAELTGDGQHVGLMIWTPGTNRWDWKSMDLHVHLPTLALRPGRADSVQPRLSGEMENWVLSPQATAVAGLRTPRTAGTGTEPLKADLVVMDLRGGRQQVFAGFIERTPASGSDGGGGDLTPHVAWSPDGLRVAGLSQRVGQQADLVVADLPAQTAATLVAGLPVPVLGTRLTWSPDRKRILAGNLVVDLQTGTIRTLPGDPAMARGHWEPNGSRLLYSLADWGPMLLIDSASGAVTPLGDGLAVGWTADGAPLGIRWPASDSRYLPPGWQ